MNIGTLTTIVDIAVDIYAQAKVIEVVGDDPVEALKKIQTLLERTSKMTELIAELNTQIVDLTLEIGKEMRRRNNDVFPSLEDFNQD